MIIYLKFYLSICLRTFQVFRAGDYPINKESNICLHLGRGRYDAFILLWWSQSESHWSPQLLFCKLFEKNKKLMQKEAGHSPLKKAFALIYGYTGRYSFFQKWAIPDLSFFISPFQYSWQNKGNTKFLPMTGFEQRTSVVGSVRSTNWSTTTAHSKVLQYCSHSYFSAHRLAFFSQAIFDYLLARRESRSVSQPHFGHILVSYSESF